MLTPRERLLVRYALTKLLGHTRLYGNLKIYAANDLEVTFSAAEILTLCNNKLGEG